MLMKMHRPRKLSTSEGTNRFPKTQPRARLYFRTFRLSQNRGNNGGHAAAAPQSQIGKSQIPMNWLAHLFLSEPDTDFRLGNLLADSIARAERPSLPQNFQRGIHQHIKIDAFTDTHP